jgi:Raf kinase inhibitor-like YbhB/YbcL family protein
MSLKAAAEMAISSPAFEQNGAIPRVYTCNGAGVSPPLVFTNVPPGTRTLAVVVDDPDVPWLLQSDRLFVHWVKWDLPPGTAGIPEGKAEGGINEDGSGYVPPCPPDSEHRYVFKLFALDTTLGATVSTPADWTSASQGHVLAQAELVGRYGPPFASRIGMLGIPAVLLFALLFVIYRLFRRFRAA